MVARLSNYFRQIAAESKLLTAVWLLAALAIGAAPASAQTSSMFQQDVAASGQPLSLANSSFLYQPPEPPRVIKLNDLITIIVDEKSQVSSEGTVNRRKQAQLNATLADWIKLNGLTNLTKDPQTLGSPEIDGTLQGQFQARSQMELRDGLKFKITGRIVDIRPNGHLVLEAHMNVQQNEEKWERSVSGIVRPEDVLPNNTVLSENVYELQVFKRERGHVRDGYRRGWLYLLIDRYGLF
jgi:flagellar L-ring protein precursor FlgH